MAAQIPTVTELFVSAQPHLRGTLPAFAKSLVDIILAGIQV